MKMHQKLKGDTPYSSTKEWIESIRETEVKFRQIIKWVSCFALAVNEVNASLGRVVYRTHQWQCWGNSRSTHVLYGH